MGRATQMLRSPLETRDTAFRLSKSRILLDELRKRAWNAQGNGLRKEGGTDRGTERQREILTI